MPSLPHCNPGLGKRVSFAHLCYAAGCLQYVNGGEGGGNPESYQGNGGATLAEAKTWKASNWSTPNLGAGLIGWTPADTMAAHGGTYGTTVAADMASQEKAMVSWMKTYGWPPPQNSWPNTAAGALSAALSASAAYEKPAVAGSDVSASEVTSVFDALATGGDLAAGGMSWVGERGPELISVTKDSTVHSATDSLRMAATAMVKPAEGPWSASGSVTVGSVGGVAYVVPANATFQTTYASGTTIYTTSGSGGTPVVISQYPFTDPVFQNFTAQQYVISAPA
jgi:hypothetical protein